MSPLRIAAPILAAAALCGSAGCGAKGQVTFSIESPDGAELSPFKDARRSTVSLVDERSGMALGTALSTTSMAGTALPIGDLPVGTYDIRISVTGQSQLLGLGRTPAVAIAAGMAEQVVLHVRKPLAFYGTSAIFASDAMSPTYPALFMGFDTTFPTRADLPRITSPPGLASASVSTSDGLLLIVGTNKGLAVLDTDNLIAINLVALDRAIGKPLPPVPRRLVLSTDDARLAVISDQGVSFGDLPAIRANMQRTLPMVPVPNAVTAAFNPDGTQLIVLAGPTWDAIACATQPAASSLITIDLTGGMPDVHPPVRVKPGTTDLAFDAAGTLLLAVPCGSGVERQDGTTALAGTGVFDIAFPNKVLAGIESALANVAPIDADGATGQMRLDGQKASRHFPIPAQYVKATLQQGPMLPVSDVLIPLQPIEFAAYRSSATPEGKSLVVASRTRYQAMKKRVVEFDLNVNGNNTNESFYCDLTVTRDVYSVSAIDTTSGSVEYRHITGHDEPQPCNIHCHFCHLVCDLKFFCNLQCDDHDDGSCAVLDGFAPSEIDVLMGSR